MSKFILSAFADEIDPDLTAQMDGLDRFGIRYIEMRGVNGKNITQHTAAEAKAVKKRLDDRGFAVSAVGSPIGKIPVTDDFEPHFELFKHTVEIAGILETKYIRMFSFFIPEGEDAGKYRDRVMEGWRRFIDIARNTGLVLLHENEKGIYGDTAIRCADLLETMDCPYLKAVFDPANFVQCDEKVYPYAFSLLKPHIAYMHIKDALYVDHSVVPSGRGDGKVREVLMALHNDNYEGFLSLEPHLGSFVGFAALERDSLAKQLPEGGLKQFAIAAEALNGILAGIR